MKTSLTKYYLSLYCKGSKGLFKVLRVRGSWRPNINCNILTPLLWPSRCVLSCSLGLLIRRPRGHSSGWWLSLRHLISNFFGLMWLSLPHLVSNCLKLYWKLPSDSNSTQLYNSSTPTRSLKSNVWSSSSGNNCHCSSQVTLFQCIRLWVYHGNFLARPISSANFRPRDFLT